jgi:hypothetical protein
MKTIAKVASPVLAGLLLFIILWAVILWIRIEAGLLMLT